MNIMKVYIRFLLVLVFSYGLLIDDGFSSERKYVELNSEELQKIALIITNRVQDIKQIEDKLCYHITQAIKQ